MAHARYAVSASHLLRDHQTICSIDALKTPTRPDLALTIGTGAVRPDPCCTVAAGEISIAPADRGAHSPAVSFTGGFRTPARQRRARCKLSDWAGIRNPSQQETHAPQYNSPAIYPFTSVARCARSVVGSSRPLMLGPARPVRPTIPPLSASEALDLVR